MEDIPISPLLSITKLEEDDLENSDTKLKFGEIFLINNTRIEIVCDCCSGDFESFDAFKNHVFEEIQSQQGHYMEFENYNVLQNSILKNDDLDISNNEDEYDYGNDNNSQERHQSTSPVESLLSNRQFVEFEVFPEEEEFNDTDTDPKTENEIVRMLHENNKVSHDDKISGPDLTKGKLQKLNLSQISDTDTLSDEYLTSDIQSNEENALYNQKLPTVFEEEKKKKIKNIANIKVKPIVAAKQVNSKTIIKTATENNKNSNNDTKLLEPDELREGKQVNGVLCKELVDELHKTCNVNRITCPFCNKIVRYRYMLFQHVAFKHLEEYSREKILEVFSQLDNEVMDSIAVIDTTDNKKKILKKIFECLICKKKYMSEDRFKKHVELHSPTQQLKYPCSYPNCNEQFTSKYFLKSHMNSHSGETYQCSYCNKVFRNDERLQYHLRSHTMPKIWQCNECVKKYLTRSELLRHIRCTHTKETICQCELCGRGFTTVSEMTYHMRRHTNTKNYVCEVCEKSFYSRYNLKIHFVTHTKEKPYKCQLCDAEFSMQGALWTHNRLHSGEKKYKCQICTKSFVQSAGLHCHMKSHNKINH